jgi:hypothetical protein
MPLFPALSDALLEAFLIHDEDDYLATTGILIRKLLQKVDQQSFNERLLHNFHACFHSEKFLHAIILGCKIIKRYPTQIPDEFVPAVDAIAFSILSDSMVTASDFTRLFFICKALQAHLLFLQIANAPLQFDQFVPFLQIMESLDINKIFNARQIKKYWELMFEIVFRCSGIDGEAHAIPPFVSHFCRFIFSIYGNAALCLERRLDPLLALARIWPKWLNSPLSLLHRSRAR